MGLLMQPTLQVATQGAGGAACDVGAKLGVRRRFLQNAAQQPLCLHHLALVDLL